MATKITIIDGICGSGESQGMIKLMKNLSYKNGFVLLSLLVNVTDTEELKLYQNITMNQKG